MKNEMIFTAVISLFFSNLFCICFVGKHLMLQKPTKMEKRNNYFEQLINIWLNKT